MKFLIAILALSLNVHAASGRLGPQSDWSDIMSSRNIQVSAATIAMNAGDVTTMVSVMDVCALNENEYMTLVPMNIWQVTRESNRTVHKVVGTARLVGTNSYVSMEKISSSSYRPLVRKIERLQRVEVQHKIIASSSSPVKLFNKDFYIPDCE